MSEDKDRRYSKIEEEILDILEKVDDSPPPRRGSNVVKFKRRRRSPVAGLRRALPDLRNPLDGLTPLKLLAATIIFAIAAVFAQNISGMLSLVLVLAAVIAFLALFIVRSGPRSSISGPKGSGSPHVKRWRGRDIVLEPRQKTTSRGWKRFLPGQRD